MIGLFFLIMIPVWRDDARLDDFHARVLAYPVPPETRVKGDSDATFGKNSGGSGDYCAYSVRLVLETRLSQKEIHAHYGRAAIAGPDNRSRAQVDLRFSEDSGNGGDVTVEFHDITPSDWDWRCT
ncbi:hypothetical protein [Nonomuraea aridisoli]|uniref:hypothetical protein n=1 Tax=Nonomuraea aridisoli TaxID=2070368 RepID=UPI0011B93599|nr:hypothetical protein [Nonomuraea aridisoli]